VFDLEFQPGHQAAEISDPLAIVDYHLVAKAETVTTIAAWCAGDARKPIATWTRFLSVQASLLGPTIPTADFEPFRALHARTPATCETGKARS